MLSKHFASTCQLILLTRTPYSALMRVSRHVEATLLIVKDCLKGTIKIKGTQTHTHTHTVPVTAHWLPPESPGTSPRSETEHS